MDTSPNSTSNADIKRKLDEKIDYHLFESTSWPIADDEVRPFFRMLEEMGLQETVPGTKNTCRYTALGIDCGTELAVCFIGAHEPYDRVDDDLDRRIGRELRLKACSRSDFIRNAIERALTEDGEERLRVAHSAIKWD